MNSRYYNPEWGRFINADGIVGQTGELLGHNLFAYCKNNPVNRFDPSGYYNEMAYDGLSGDSAAGGGSLLDVIFNIGLIVYFQATTEKSKADVATSDDTKKQKQHEVYVLVNSKSEAEYVGRTSRTTDVRYNEHKKTPIGAGLNPIPIAKGLTYPEARGLEQILYDHYKHSGNTLRNSISPISAINPLKWEYIAAGAEYLTRYPDIMDEIKQWDKK